MPETPPKELSPEEIKSLAEVQQLILALEKYTRSQKLYLENNPILVQHRDRLNSFFAAFLKENTELLLHIKPNDLLFLEQSVYHNENKKESFAFRLYTEGMRSVRFAEGLTPEELDGFVRLLNVGSASAENLEQVGRLLWEQEFEHIVYEIATYVIDDPNLDVDTQATEILDPEKSQYSGPSPTGPPEEIEEEISQEDLLPQSEFTKIAREICVLEEQEFEQIQREISSCEQHDRVMLDLFDILIVMLLEESDPNKAEQLFRLIVETIDSTVLNGKLHITAQILGALRNLLQPGTGDFALRHTDRIQRLVASLGTQEKINRYLNALNIGYTGSVKDIVDFFALMPKTSFPFLLNQIQIVASPQLRKEISIAIAQLYDGKIEHFERAFKAIKRPNHLLDILFILSHTRDNRAVSYMRPLFQHPDRNVKIAAIATLRELAIKESVPMLLSLLEDQDSEIRLHSARTLATSNDHSVGRFFLEKIQSQELLELPLQEKKVYFFTTAKLLGDDFLPHLQKLLKQKSLFRRRTMDEMHQCAAFALKAIGTDAALHTLRTFEKSGSKTVRAHCQRELKRSANPT